jgi:hypothetical protein
MTTITKTNENELATALKFQEMSLEELKVEADKLGVKLRTTDKAEVIEALITASVQRPETAKPGMLISLHSQDDEALKTIVAARNVILQNTQAGKFFSLFLKNKEGDFYTQRAAGCKVSPERLESVLKIVTALPDGSQDEILQELKTQPEAFDEPLLVRVQRRNADGTYRHYVMLYVKHKQKLVEQAF